MNYSVSIEQAAEYALDDLISDYKERGDTIQEQKERIAELEKQLDDLQDRLDSCQDSR